MSLNIVEMNIFVPPLKVMNDSFVSKFLFDDEDILEEVYDSLVDIEVIELCDHCLLTFKI